MNLSNQVNQQLNQFLTNQDPNSVLQLDTDQGRLTCQLTAVDQLACSFLYLNLTSTALQNASVDRLREVGQRLSARLNYLLEPINSIELDAQGVTLQMRSNPPQRDDDGCRYYELVVSRMGRINLQRYCKSPADTSRQEIPANVTREVLCRLVADFTAAAA